MQLKSDQIFHTQDDTEKFFKAGTAVKLAQEFENDSPRILVSTVCGSMNWIKRSELMNVPKMKRNHLPCGSTFTW